MTASLMAGCSQHLPPNSGLVPRCTGAFPARYSVVPKMTRCFDRTKGAPSVTQMASAAVDPVLDDTDPFRLRLLEGLAASIGERGYRATTVADIVRHARTSKRTFYDQFASKEQCFLSCCVSTTTRLGDEHSGGCRSRGRLAPADPSGGRGVRGNIEARPADHLELDSRAPVAGRRRPPAAAPRVAAVVEPADRSQCQPGLSAG